MIVLLDSIKMYFSKLELLVAISTVYTFVRFRDSKMYIKKYKNSEAIIINDEYSLSTLG